MYDAGAGLRSAGRHAAMLPEVGGPATFRLALQRVRNLLGDCLPGMSADAGWLRQALAQEQADPAAEAERRSALGWVAWLDGDWAGAEGLLADGRIDAAGAAPAQDADTARSPLLDPAWRPYWRARIRLLLGRAAAVAEYEATLKRLAGSPQATVWYVDLLWRGGRPDRAEQVWKSVRGNRRLAACDEVVLLEARLALRKGEYASGERLLRDASPRGGVAQVERHLLLAWAGASQRKAEQALDALRCAAAGPYPARALDAWRRLVEARLRGEPLSEGAPPGWEDYLKGQEARALGREEEAIAHYRAALSSPAHSFAAHALTCLGVEELQTPPPGLFFAVRARALQAAARFCRRELTPGEFLEALEQAARAGVEVAAFDGYRRLARLLQERSPVVAAADPSPAALRNALRVAVESAARLPAQRRRDVLTAMAGMPLPDDVRPALGRQLLRLALQRRERFLLDLARPLLSPDSLAAAEVLFGETTALSGDEAPPATLWLAAKTGDVQKLHQRSFEGIYRSLRQAVLLAETARLGDPAGVALLLEELDAWRAFRAGPPRFVVAALAALAASRPSHPAWPRALPGWLALWKPQALGEGFAVLASVAGMAAGEAPAGVDPEAWFLHQAARALLRDDASAALAFLRRASPRHSLLPALERRAQAAHLARCLGYDLPALLTDFVDLLRGQSEGQALLDAAARGDAAAVEHGLAILGERPDLPGRLLHHLALAETHLARRHETGDALLATLHARRAWGAWLGFLAGPEGPPADGRALLLDHLLTHHHERVHDHLARDELGPACSHWQLVLQLPALARDRAPSLADDLAARVGRFRDQFATDFLLTTREAMRFGNVPEGFRADYERGLALLGRALALDGDNVRLLTAYAETCVDLFFDLYQLQDRRLFTEIDRLLGPAERLAELVAGREGEGAARAALSDYWKFRGFAAGDRATKAALYREALRLNPGNDNVRDLLARLEGEGDG